MQINNNLNCCKPRKRLTFQGKSKQNLENRKVRYKHYEQMSDENLMIHSIAKAYKSVKNSGKMQLYKAMPTIAATIVGTTIAISQPGKLSNKASQGLGFLVLAGLAGKAIDFSNKIVDKNTETNKAKPLIKTLTAIGTIAAAALAGFGALMCGKNLLNKINPNISKFFNGEITQLANEINNTKLGNFVEKSLNPFVEKHQTKFKIAKEVSPFLAALGGITIQNKLSKSIAKNLQTKTNENFTRAKQIQQSAKAHYDSIEAEEV